MANYYSDLENKSLVWLKTIIYIFIAFHLLWIVEDLIGFQFETVAGYFAYLSNLGTYFMIFWIGYNGFSQPEIFATELFSVSPNSKKDSNTETAADRGKIPRAGSLYRRTRIVSQFQSQPKKPLRSGRHQRKRAFQTHQHLR